MEKFIFFKADSLQRFVKKRAGETKLGQRLEIISSFDDLSESQAQYVIFGVPEDVGIRANFGKPGAAQTWNHFLSAFLNIQINSHNPANRCLILGEVDCREFMEEADRLVKTLPHPEEELGTIVYQIDKIVAQVVQKIVEAGKTPIVIGGGHNNAYPNIKGTSQALGQAVNILNIDAHTDLRTADYRHSGNGFSFAKKEGSMDKYLMFGIHKNYTPQYIFEACKKNEDIQIDLYDDIMGMDKATLLRYVEKEITFLGDGFGLEIDCDAIENFSSSAMTPSGFSVENIRNLINFLKQKNILYLHLAEAADAGNGQVGKALSYFVSDFIRRTDKNASFLK